MVQIQKPTDLAAKPNATVDVTAHPAEVHVPGSEITPTDAIAIGASAVHGFTGPGGEAVLAHPDGSTTITQFNTGGTPASVTHRLASDEVRGATEA